MSGDWVLDATNDDGTPPHCFCPIEGDDVVFGMNLITDRPPGRLAGVVHMDGQDAAEAWCHEHAEVIEQIRAAEEEGEP